MSHTNYHNKKVAVLGLSTEGLDAALFFSHRGAHVYCCDRRTEAQLGETYAQLKELGATFRLGEKYLADLDQYDLLIRTPGMALFLPELQQVQATISSVTKIFFDECPAPIIGVTGTKGKGTTSTLIYEMLKKSGRKSYLGGNIGTPLLSQVDTIDVADWVVLELSSFQLEDLHASPHVAVVLTVTSDHLANFDKMATNYHRSQNEYVAAKTAIVRFQKQSDFVISNADTVTSTAIALLSKAQKLRYGHTREAEAVIADDTVYLHTSEKLEKICALEEVKLLGRHNLENIAAASLAAMCVGVGLADIRHVAKVFPGLEHRLEKAVVVKNVTYINDSFSTVPETAIAAVHSFAAPIILIAGGSEKGSDFTQLGKEIAQSSVKALILIGQMTERIKKAALDAGFTGECITGLYDMQEVVSTAAARAKPGDVVLLSPACASFDMFKSYKQRGKLFKTYAAALT